MADATGSAEMTPGKDHHTAFNEALEAALNDMAGKFQPGKHTVDVHQQLLVDVNSPGNIGWVKVTLRTAVVVP